MTYEGTVGNVGDQVSITVNLWFNTTSELIPNRKVEEIAQAISMGGCTLTHDDGAIWVKRGRPWCNSLEGEQSRIKRRILNIDLEFM